MTCMEGGKNGNISCIKMLKKVNNSQKAKTSERSGASNLNVAFACKNLLDPIELI